MINNILETIIKMEKRFCNQILSSFSIMNPEIRVELAATKEKTSTVFICDDIYGSYFSCIIKKEKTKIIARIIWEFMSKDDEVKI